MSASVEQTAVSPPSMNPRFSWNGYINSSMMVNIHVETNKERRSDWADCIEFAFWSKRVAVVIQVSARMFGQSASGLRVMRSLLQCWPSVRSKRRCLHGPCLSSVFWTYAFEDWPELLGNQRLIGVNLDRRAHLSHNLEIGGEIYRLMNAKRRVGMSQTGKKMSA